MHRSIVARAHAWTLECFPYRGIRLPRGKTQSVSSIEYASGGEMLVLNGPSSSPVGTGYQEDLTDDDGGVVQYPLGSSWPSPDTGSISPVRINFAAGYLSEELPEDILTAVLFAIADLYEIRGTSEMESLDAAGRFAAVRETLISPYCLSRWHAGSYR
jgi:hypothetical protein